MKYHITILCIIISFIKPCYLLPQTEIEKVHYSTLNGLANNAISDILYDSRGYVWIGTWNGLSRFDGFEFVNYKTGVDSEIPYLHNRISRLFEDKHGNIWLLMYDQKMFRLNRKTDKIESIIKFLPGENNTRLKNPLLSLDGNIWLLSLDNEILEINTDTITNELNIKLHNIRDSKVNQLFEDSFQTIWAATNKGIQVLKSKRSQKNSFNKEGASVSVQQGNSIYWGTESGNIIIYNYINNAFTYRELKISNPIMCMASSSKESAIYIGTAQKGLFRYDIERDKLKQIIHNPSDIRNLYTDSEGLIWILTEQSGVTMYDPTLNIHTSFNQKVAISENRHNSEGEIIEVSGTVWVRMNQGGFGYYDRKSKKIDYFHNNPNDPASISNIVSVAEITSPHVLWISTYKRGVDKISIIDKKVDRIRINNNQGQLLANDFRTFHLDKDNTLWAASKAGVLYHFNDRMEIIERIASDGKGIPFGRIYAISQDDTGSILLGTRGNGLIRITKDEKGCLKFERYINNPADPFSLSNDHIFDILIDSRKQIWIATFGGGINLMKKDGDDVKFLSSNNSFKKYPISSCNKIRTLVEDRKGRIWAGTTEGLVVMSYNADEQEVYSTIYRKEANSKTSLSNNDIVCMYKDKENIIWIGTIGGGLNKSIETFDKEDLEFLSYTIQDGLPSNEIKSITEDKDGNIWFATEHIICSLNPSRNTFSTLSTLDGVDDTILSESAAITMADGRILFGSIDGYYLIDKKKLTNISDTGFKLQITDFQINEEDASPRINPLFDQYVPESKSVILPNRHVTFSFKFASLNYDLQHRIQYQYMLEGYDSEWINSTKDRRASYANIPAGNYTFKIKAFLPENPELYEIRTLEVKVPRYLWESQKAIAIYILILFLIIMGIWWLIYRRRVALENHRVLNIGPSQISFRDDKDYNFISSLLEWLEQNYANPELRIEDMVTFSGLGRTTFYNYLKTLTQMSPIEFISDFRMKKAKMYIEKTNNTISEIAYRTGFSDPAYFTRLFKSRYNMTPSEYRKNIPFNSDTIDNSRKDA